MRTDVIVVGAGITGALVAEATTAMGLDTVVLDRRISPAMNWMQPNSRGNANSAVQLDCRQSSSRTRN
jgi:flavin-dependent dehydrogenase